MPNIELVPVISYAPLMPYDHLTDNLPITGLIERVFLVNNQVDNLTTIMNDAIGTQGTLANRLNQSINQDGSLKTTAIDNALHSIAEHLDTSTYVRMTLDERDKLSNIAVGATNLSVAISSISGIVAFSNGVLNVAPSDSIVWRVVNGMTLFADTNFPSSVRHNHYYGLTPIPLNIFAPDYINYYVTNALTAYRGGSLRVYVNGVRLNESTPVYVPTGFPSVTWQAFSYLEDVATGGIVTSGKFSLSSAIPSSAVITVDFDVLYS